MFNLIVVKTLKPFLCSYRDGVLLKFKKQTWRHYSSSLRIVWAWFRPSVKSCRTIPLIYVFCVAYLLKSNRTIQANRHQAGCWKCWNCVLMEKSQIRLSWWSWWQLVNVVVLIVTQKLRNSLIRLKFSRVLLTLGPDVVVLRTGWYTKIMSSIFEIKAFAVWSQQRLKGIVQRKLTGVETRLK